MKYQVRESTGWYDAPKSDLFDTREEAEKELKRIIDENGQPHYLFHLYIYCNRMF